MGMKDLWNGAGVCIYAASNWSNSAEAWQERRVA